MRVAMLGEDMYKYDFEPDTMNGYYDSRLSAYERGTGIGLDTIPPGLTIFDVPDETGNGVVSSDTKEQRERIQKTDPERAENIKTIAGEVRRGITDIATVVRDGILSRNDAALAQDEADNPVMDKTWFEKNQTALILGGTGIAALLIIGMTMQRRRRRR